MNTPNFYDSDYQAHISQIQKVNDVYNGIDTAKKYIKQFTNEKPETYQARQDEATLDNYVFRTVDTTKNIVFRKPVKIESNNNDLISWLEKVNFQNDINSFAKKVLVNRIKDGKTYILVDTPSYDKDTLVSKADLEQNNIRPYANNIKRSQIINKEYDDNMMLRQVSIAETYKYKTDRFGYEIKEQIRVYEIIENNVQVSIWREDEETILPPLNIPIIPLIEIGNNDIPPLYDQAIININHLNRNSEKSNYVRVGAAPFPLVWGAAENASAATLGINQGFSFKGNKNETGFEWAEMSGSNYNMIQEEIKYREEQMERISVEFVTQLKNATATEVEKASMANESKLMDYSVELEEGLNTMIQYFGLFTDGISEDDMVVTNKDFNANILTPEQFNVLMQLRTNGDISYNRMMDILEQGEVLPMLDEKDRVTEETLLRNEGNI